MLRAFVWFAPRRHTCVRSIRCASLCGPSGKEAPVVACLRPSVPVIPVVWRVVALTTPRVIRHCPRCGRARPFVSSDKFRVNAQKRRLDVWLIYKCADCDATWNVEVRARCLPEELSPELFAGFQQNEAAAAWAHAFDRDLLERAGARVDPEVPYRIDRPPFPSPGSNLVVELRFDHPCGVRLDRLVCAELATSRSRLDQLLRRRLVRLNPDDARAWRRPARAGQRLEIAAEALPASPG
jgi:hypothetical protein